MAFRWPADDGLLLMVFGSPTPHLLKKKSCRGGTPLTRLSGSAHASADMYPLQTIGNDGNLLRIF